MNSAPMPTPADRPTESVVDVVVVGSGGGGLSAAIAAARRGASVCLIEKQSVIGGSTVLSGGTLWFPANPTSLAAGLEDTRAEALTYLDAVVGETATTEQDVARRPAFVDASLEVHDWLAELGMPWRHCRAYPDYYDTAPGGKAEGRVVEVEMLDRAELGPLADWMPTVSPPVVAYSEETAALSAMGHGARSRRALLRVAARTAKARATRTTMLAGGAAFVARLLVMALDSGVQVRRGHALDELIVEDGSVVGVTGTGPDGPFRIRAKGVIVASGGWSRSPTMRQENGPWPTGTDWTIANPGDTGEVIQAAQAAGADTARMDESWWQPGTVMPDGSPGPLLFERAKPHGIMVDSGGHRFVDEASSYMAVGRAMYAHGAVPAWLVVDARHRRRYVWGYTAPGRMPKAWLDAGTVHGASSIEELATRSGIDPAGLVATVERFNEMARTGVDTDFGRGESAYGRYYADDSHGPNPSLGTLERGPFYAAPVYPGDIGSAGGLLVDEHARVIRTDGTVLPGLYATGNAAASLMGRTYPASGVSIAESVVFGHVAAIHLLATAGSTVTVPR
ncbi:MAG: FAD-dependent oxidoreductase [Aeromicrobium sp.]